MITANEAKKRTAISIKEWEKRHEAVLQRIEEDIINRADEGYDYYAYIYSDDINLNKLGEVLISKGFSVYKTASNDGLKISWE